MTRVLLDSSAYIAAKKGHPAVRDIFLDAHEIVMSPIVLGELRVGMLQGCRQARHEQELQDFLDSIRVSVLAIDEETAERYAIIRVGLKKAGTPIPVNDIWIAASAMQYGLPIVTSDRDFQRIPQVLVHVIG